MEPLLLINPSPRKGKGRKMARKHRTTAQKRATARLVALNRSRRGGHKRRAKRGTAYASNPAPRHHRRTRRAGAVHRARKHYRRNPSPRMGGIMSMFKPALAGAVGALGIDLITGYVPLPLAFKVSPARHALKGILAIGFGMVFKGNFGRNAAIGGLTVALHDAAKETVQTAMPTVQLGAEPTVADLQGVGYYSPPQVEGGMGAYQSEAGLSEYESNYV